MPPYRLFFFLSLLFATVAGTLAISAGGTSGAGVNPVLYDRQLVPQQVAAAVKQIGVLRNVNTSVLMKRLTALGRAQASDTNGPQSNGQTVTSTNWTLTPTGQQTTLGDFPVNAVLSPDGRHLLVVNSGAGVQSIQMVDPATSRIVQTIPYAAPASVFIGAAFSPDSKNAYVSGGGQNVVHTFAVNFDGSLSPTGDIALPALPANPLSTSQYPAGLSVANGGRTLYVADSNTLANNVAVIDVPSKSVTKLIPVGRTPYGTAVDPTLSRIFVSNWGDGTVSVIDPATNLVMATIPVGQHPSAMTFGPYGILYVSDSNSDAVSVINTQSLSEIRRLSVVGNISAPFSSSPQGLSYANLRLYVANAGNNAIAVFRVDPYGRGETFQGWIPTAWYPTSVTVGPDGGSLFVTNGWGMGEAPNNAGSFPNPTRNDNSGIVQAVTGFADTYCHCTFDQFSGSMDVGTLSTIPLPTTNDLLAGTMQVLANDHYLDQSPADRSPGNPVPVPGGSSPIKHVIYIIKENRTYDQVFGDEKAGNGDPSLTLFGKANTPNLHALAERFGLIDNFYADAQVSADGHNWILSANASDYDNKLWPQDYSAAPGRNFGYPFESGTAVPQSPGGYLWDNAAASGLTYRTYGEYTDFCCTSAAAATIQPASAPCAGPSTPSYLGLSIPAGSVACFPPTTINAQTAPNLVGHSDPQSPPYDTNFPDVQRAALWKREFDQFVANGSLPALELIRIPQDHTKGTQVGQLTPQAMVADNDQAVGNIVDAVSHSPYWASTAIFITEDDAQNGPDHVDSHRTEALVISPYTSSASVRAIHTHYDTASMVRTIELLLGMRAMSQYDATATPMWQLFSSTPDATPYTAQPETVPAVPNAASAFDAKLSATFNFTLPDQAPSYLMNRILWHAIKGSKTPYPNLPAFRATRYVTPGYFERVGRVLLIKAGLISPRTPH